MKWALIFLLLISNTFAETPSAELENKSKDFAEVLESQENSKSLSLNLIRVRTTLDAGVEIPGVTNAIVSPEIELFFTK